MRITTPAAAQLARAQRWWRSHRDKAPRAFAEEIGAAIERLGQVPRMLGHRLEDNPKVRRMYLPRIRYFLYFTVSDEGDLVDIVALWHGNRGTTPRIT